MCIRDRSSRQYTSIIRCFDSYLNNSHCYTWYNDCSVYDIYTSSPFYLSLMTLLIQTTKQLHFPLQMPKTQELCKLDISVSTCLLYTSCYLIVLNWSVSLPFSTTTTLSSLSFFTVLFLSLIHI